MEDRVRAFTVCLSDGHLLVACKKPSILSPVYVQLIQSWVSSSGECLWGMFHPCHRVWLFLKREKDLHLANTTSPFCDVSTSVIQMQIELLSCLKLPGAERGAANLQ